MIKHPRGNFISRPLPHFLSSKSNNTNRRYDFIKYKQGEMEDVNSIARKIGGGVTGAQVHTCAMSYANTVSEKCNF